MTEWRTIEEFPEYQISEDGDMRRLSGGRYRVSIIKGWVCKSTSYRMFTFNRKNLPKPEHRAIHRLVAIAFIGPPPSADHEVAHNDGTRTNNHHTNLRWCTHIENEKDKIQHGTLIHSELNHLAKMQKSDVLYVREQFANGATFAELANTMNTTYANIWSVVRRKSWKHI